MGGRGHFEAQKLTFTRRKIDAVNRGVRALQLRARMAVYARRTAYKFPDLFLSAIATNTAYIFLLEIV